MKEMGHALSAEGGVVLGDQPSLDSFSVSVERLVKAEAERVFIAIHNTEDLNTWFSAEALAEYCSSLTLLEAEAPLWLKFAWRRGNQSLVRIELEPVGDSTMVRLEHLNLESFEEACYLNVGWNWAMDSLKHFLEEGSGVRYEDWKTKREASVAIS